MRSNISIASTRSSQHVTSGRKKAHRKGLAHSEANTQKALARRFQKADGQRWGHGSDGNAT